jgi:hypothetical protein
MVDEAVDKHNILFKLWHAKKDWSTKVAVWQEQKFNEIDVKLISAEADEYTKIVTKCKNGMADWKNGADAPVESSALQALDLQVSKFRETMPVVRALGNNDLQPEHWDEIKELL